ncbi:MAG: hypothetical protein ACRDPJ_11135 [Nocardioidaceae bacterium]
MDERENHEAQQEALKEAAGKTSKSRRDQIQEGLAKYLMAEARRARKVAEEQDHDHRDRERQDRERQDRE